MECAIGMARRAMAPRDFKLVGPAIHLALPEFGFKNCQLSRKGSLTSIKSKS